MHYFVEVVSLDVCYQYPLIAFPSFIKHLVCNLKGKITDFIFRKKIHIIILYFFQEFLKKHYICDHIGGGGEKSLFKCSGHI